MRIKEEKLELLQHINKVFPSKHWSIKKLCKTSGKNLYQLSFRKKPIIRTFHEDIAFEHYVLTPEWIFDRLYVGGLIKIICKLGNPSESKAKNRKIVI